MVSAYSLKSLTRNSLLGAFKETFIGDLLGCNCEVINKEFAYSNFNSNF